MDKGKLNETIPIEEATIYDNSDEKLINFAGCKQKTDICR